MAAPDPPGHERPAAAVRVCFVCLGNICRSPTAEGILRRQLEEADLAHLVEVDSAGTGGWHVGSPPDGRAVAEARRRGTDLAGLRGRQLEPDDLDRFDLVLVMDRTNLDDVRALATTEAQRAKVRLVRELDPAGGPHDVPDPYHGGPDGFARVYDLLEAACRGVVDEVRGRLP